MCGRLTPLGPSRLLELIGDLVVLDDACVSTRCTTTRLSSVPETSRRSAPRRKTGRSTFDGSHFNLHGADRVRLSVFEQNDIVLIVKFQSESTAQQSQKY